MNDEISNDEKKLLDIMEGTDGETSVQRKELKVNKKGHVYPNKGTKTRLKRLKITRLDGKILNYAICGEYITMHDSKNISGVDIKPEQLEDLIAELQELQEVVE